MASFHLPLGRKRYTRTSGNASGFLAKGSYGSVYLAMDSLTHQLVAIKTQRLPSDSAERELVGHLFLLRHPHPNLISLLDYYMVPEQSDSRGNSLAMVLPLCDTSLHRLELPTLRAEAYAQGVLAGVAHLHQLGIMHADLSLANCLVDRDDVVRVGDLGTSRSSVATCLFAEGLAPGIPEQTTSFVRAPERWLGLETVDFPIDAWAVGVVIYCLSRGHMFTFHVVWAWKSEKGSS